MSSGPESSPKRYEPTSPDELLTRTKHRSLELRRRRLFGAGGAAAVVVALVLWSVLIGGGGGGGVGGGGRGNRPPTPASGRSGTARVAERIGSAYELTADTAAAAAASPKVLKGVESAEVGFSLDLLDHLAGSNDSSNQLVSPSSLSTALAMLELGASGSTERGIATTLRTAGFSAGAQAAGWHSIAALLAAVTSTNGNDLAKTPELNIANALWVQDHFTVQQAFLRALSSDFQTGVWQADFQDNLTAATDAINQWTSENTKGLIKQLFSPGALNQYTRLVLADAVYFDAHWATAFKSATKNETFHLASGGTESVPFMSSPTSGGPSTAGSPKPLTAPAAVTSSYDAVELPYGGKRLSALVVMPTSASLPDFVSSLTATFLNRLVTGLRPGRVNLSMPTFTIRSDDQLNSTLSSMGMSQAFGPAADLSGISQKVGLQVQSVEQRALLQVTPKGTVAAAATGVGISALATEVEVPIVIDHPFLFLVRDNATGTILFEAMVENPAG